MTPWMFRDYVTADDHDVFDEWYSAQDDAVQAALDATLYLLRATNDWLDERVGEFKQLTGKHAGLSEIMFDIQARQPGGRQWTKRRFRPAGLWRPEQRDFILFVGCEKRLRGLIYIPAGAFDRALEYKVAFEQGKGGLRERL